MKILVKLPSRQRPIQLLSVLNGYIEKQETDRVHYLLTLDDNDNSVSKLRQVLAKQPFITIATGNSSGKINACNRGMYFYKGDWDILVLASDDMICQKKGWDRQLIEEMTEYFPDKDGVLFHNDGYCGDRLNTMCILGHKYYDRFKYIYNPSYKSLFCDNEFMDVANVLGKQKYFPEILFKHEHPANNSNVKSDHLYNVNDKHFLMDKKLYEKRKKENFGLINIDSNAY